MSNILIHPATRQDKTRIAFLEQTTGMRVIWRESPHALLISRGMYELLCPRSPGPRRISARRKPAPPSHHLDYHPGPEAA